jgi:hypothetical protein
MNTNFHPNQEDMMATVSIQTGVVDADRWVTSLIEAFPYEGKNPDWVPDTSIEWLQPLRERHRIAVLKRRGAIRDLPGALNALASEEEAFGRAVVEHALEERRALTLGRTLPTSPVASGAAVARVEQVWADIDRHCNDIADVVQIVADSVAARRDELWRTHVAHARARAGRTVSVPAGFTPDPLSLVQDRVDGLYTAIIDNPTCIDLRSQVGAMREFVRHARHEADLRPSARVQQGVAWGGSAA